MCHFSSLARLALAPQLFYPGTGPEKDRQGGVTWSTVSSCTNTMEAARLCCSVKYGVIYCHTIANIFYLTHYNRITNRTSA